MRIGIVGGGVSGLAAARAAIARGAEVVVFDKGRGFGGRLSTRRVETERGRIRFNHGAPRAHGDSEAFRDIMNEMVARGAARWVGREAIVGVPTMNRLVAALGDGIDVRFEIRAVALEHDSGALRIINEKGDALGAFDALVLAIPAPQAIDLLPAEAVLRKRLGVVRYEPRWCAMLALREDPFESEELAGDGAILERLVRTEPGAWTAHATASWSVGHLEDEKQDAGRALSGAAAALAPAFARPRYVAAHRWRFARVSHAIEDRFLIDRASSIVCCGDGFGGRDVGAAIESGLAAGAAAAGCSA